jgi:hypothetical protein
VHARPAESLPSRHGITFVHLGDDPAEVVVTLEANRTYFGLVDFQAELDAALFALREIRRLVSEGGRDGLWRQRRPTPSDRMVLGSSPASSLEPVTVANAA